jgi:hypothetical protein
MSESGIRISVSIDGQRLAGAMAATALSPKHEVIEPGLHTMRHPARQEAFHQYSSTISWRGLMDRMQRDRPGHARDRPREITKQLLGCKRIRLTWRKPYLVRLPLRRFRVRRARFLPAARQPPRFP